MTGTISQKDFIEENQCYRRLLVDGNGGLEPKEIRVLRLLTKQRLLPRELSDLSGLNLSETLDAVGTLLRGGLIAKISDGFSGFLYITDKGNGIVNGNK